MVLEIRMEFDETIELADNAMLKHRPELFYEWDFEKNGKLGLDVYRITQGSGKKAWWECPTCKSNYNMEIHARTGKRKYNCPYCSGDRVNHTNSLASLDPEMVLEWHPTKNRNITPNDVHHRSGKKVWWSCPKCESEYVTAVDSRTGSKRSNCPYCARVKVNHTNSLNSLNPELASEWHPTLNGELTSDDVASKSNKVVWWLGKCGHKWDTSIDKRAFGEGCPYCSNNRILIGFNDMWTTNPKLASLLNKPEDGYKYTQNSNVKVNWKCSECLNIIKSKQINAVNQRGVCCPRCSDGLSFGEKFVYNILKELAIDFEFNREQKWSQQARYDFYFVYNNENYIIEVNGIQHYGRGFSGMGGRGLKEEQENDIAKEKIARNNGVENYIIIDARESTVEWLQQSILNSPIAKIVENVDLEKIGRLSTKSGVKDACDLWMSGIQSPSEIADILKLSTNTITTYLKRGVEIGWCDYCPKETLRRGALKVVNSRKKAVIQLDKNLLFIKSWESTGEIERQVGLKAKTIYAACVGKSKTSSGYKWMYKEDYDKMIQEGLTHEEYMSKYYPKTK